MVSDAALVRAMRAADLDAVLEIQLACYGAGFVRHAWAQAAQAGWRHSTLVSVQSSVGFWERQGYAATQPEGAEQQARLATYPGRSVYMIRRLEPGLNLA